jgi:hypothetical protein
LAAEALASFPVFLAASAFLAFPVQEAPREDSQDLEASWAEAPAKVVSVPVSLDSAA